MYDDFEVAADSVETNYDPYDMAEGEKIQGLAGTNGVMNLTITGYEEYGVIDLLIPVLGRPSNVQPLLDSIVGNTIGPYQIIFICSPGDDEQIEACRKSGYNTWVVEWEPARADYARKINWAFAQTDSEWIFQGADDIRFSKDWDTKALRYGERFSVIGTNDLHNPSVKRGIHSTHILFRRSYIEKYGGTFEDPGRCSRRLTTISGSTTSSSSPPSGAGSGTSRRTPW